MKEVIGKSYGLSTSKLLKKHTIKKNPGVQVEEDRTFFCSELIAKAYKVLGVMECDGRASSKYFPNNFTSEKDHTIKFKIGMRL